MGRKLPLAKHYKLPTAAVEPVLIACDKYIDGELNPVLASSHPSRTLESFSRAKTMTNSIGKPGLILPDGFGTSIPPTFGTWYFELGASLEFRVWSFEFPALGGLKV